MRGRKEEKEKFEVGRGEVGRRKRKCWKGVEER